MKEIVLEIKKTETEIQLEITKYLKSKGWTVYRMNSGRKGGMRLNKKNTPDLLAQSRGHSIWIEVKKPGEDPTPGQKKRHKELRDDGFKVFVICSLEELISYSKK